MFFRKSTIEPLPVTMSGVRMGERLLQIGIDDPEMAGRMAAKVGLSGNAALVVDDERAAARARAAVAAAGVLVDVQVAPLGNIPFAADAFDVIVVHSANGWLAGIDPATRASLLIESWRVLRKGGRLVVIESGARRGLGRWTKPAPAGGDYERTGGTTGAVTAAGFRSARVVGEREGYRFVEGLKG